MIVNAPRPLGAPLESHTGGVWEVAFAPDGRALASGGGDKAVRLWDLTNRADPRPLATLEGHIRVVLICRGRYVPRDSAGSCYL